MTDVGQRERITQNRVVKMFRETLGYGYLGNWEYRQGNSNVEDGLLRAYLQRQGYEEALIGRAIFKLNQAATDQSKELYYVNKDVYSLLRYGVKVKADVSDQTQTVWLIDWEHPRENDFAVAEEVTVTGAHTKRPDVVLYVNGIALGVLELKRPIVAVSEGIRQNLDNQKKDFIQPFFATVQPIMAGNDTEGLRYGVIETPEKYHLTWKESGDGVETPVQTPVQTPVRRDARFCVSTVVVAKWKPIIGVEVTDWRVKRMKTRWGTCTIEARRIWLNLELVKKPPQWRLIRDELDQAPLAHET